jgi:hypothetical protein
LEEWLSISNYGFCNSDTTAIWFNNEDREATGSYAWTQFTAATIILSPRPFGLHDSLGSINPIEELFSLVPFYEKGTNR